MFRSEDQVLQRIIVKCICIPEDNRYKIYSNKLMHVNSKKNNIAVPMILLGTMFALQGFALGINAFFIPFVKEAFNISTFMSYLIMTATFSAFVIFGPFSGGILKRAGYKGGMVISFSR